MDYTILVSAPLNMGKHDEKLFLPNLTYTISDLKVLHLTNVIVSSNGFVIQNHKLIEESYHDPSDENFQENFLHIQESLNSDKLQMIDLNNKKTYLCIHHVWYNYFHWITEAILRLFMVRDRLKNLILLLPDYYKDSDFITGSLKPFNIPRIYYLPKGSFANVGNLILPEMKPKVHSYHQQMLLDIRNLYLNYSGKNYPNNNLGERLYISRAKAVRKKIANESDIIPLLEEFGFRIICNENYTFLEQVKIFSNAKYLISIHGSGLTNMIFMKQNSTILEFHKRHTNSRDSHSLSFWYLADVLKFQYYHQLCNPTNKQDDYFNANFIVNINILKKNLRRIFKK